MTPQEILEKLKSHNKDFSVRKEIPEWNTSYRTYHLMTDSKELAWFRVVIGSMPYCCGAIEIGDARLSLEESIGEPVKVLLAAYAFSDLREEFSDSYGRKRPREKILSFYSNENRPCNLVEEAIKEYLSDSYKLVAQTTNPNTDNHINMYVSC